MVELRLRGWFVAGVALACAGACAREPGRPSSASSSPLVHLADQLEHATVKSASVPATARTERTWSFAEKRDDWRVLSEETADGMARVKLELVADATRLSIERGSRGSDGPMVGGLAIDLESTPIEQWTSVIVRARSHDRLAGIAAACNVGKSGSVPRGFGFFMGAPGTSPVFNDGSVQSYSLPLTEHEGETLESIGVFVSAPQPARLDILSVTLVPRGAAYKEEVGVHALTRGTETRRTLYAHTPASLAWKLRVPDRGRLDLALTSLLGEEIAYKAGVHAGSEKFELFGETAKSPEAWLQRSLDLSRWAGREVELTLEATSTLDGSVALFGAPIVSSGRGVSSGAGVSGDTAMRPPNVIFYVIDGGGADLMSVYGYNRRTTPYLERLATEGVVFEHAYSNSTWTQSSTASFMTSLHHSVLGGLRRGVHSTPVPAAATTMAEYMRRGGYATAVLTTNPNCARVIGLERGVDLMNDGDSEDSSTSSTALHELFWKLRHDYPGRPFWVHFQTTDVHEPNHSVAPYAGLYVSAAERRDLDQWEEKMFESAGDLFGTTSIAAFYDTALAKAEIDRHAFFNARRGLYDETMAHQDRELARLVDRLKAQGEWQDTLLVIAADHGHPAGTFARWGRGLFDPQPEPWQGALFDSYSTRVPLIFIWPKKIPGGKRIQEPVSMIDVLPTILDLANLPPPEVAQGRSLVPLLMGGKLDPRPVVLDEFRVDEATGEMCGNLEMIDGRWGASLEIGPVPSGANAERGRHTVPAGGRWGAVHPFFADVPRLLLYDLWKDPFALRAVNDEHPDVVAHYEKALLAQWEAHKALAQRYGEAGAEALTPESLKQLRDLGYVR